jgi:hypothetical protein
MERTWSYNFGIEVANRSSSKNMSAWLVWELKQALVTAGFVVEGSSDASTAALDGVDRWGAVFDTTKIIRAAAGVAHSWITLSKTTASWKVYLTLDCTGAADLTMLLPKACHGTLTGGTTLNCPTGTENAAFSASLNMHDNTLAAHKVHFIYSNAGDFLFFTTKTGVTAHRVFGMFVSDSFFTDPHPYYFVNGYTATDPFKGTPAISGTFWSPNSWACFDPATGAGKTATGGACLALPYSKTVNGTFLGGSGGAGGSIYDGKHRDFPIFFVTDDDIRGRLVDISLLVTAPAMFSSLLDESNNPIKTSVGYLLIPCNTTPVT